ncbi:hypothetical protein N7490_011553 [Penicillium lividum]|nr:hypothetical protein N7490_011553 [Penicillium lividum]
MPDSNLFSNTGLPERFVLTKLQVPGELDDAQLTEYFQPLLHTPGHNRSMWGMIQDKPKTALLATLWETTDAIKYFQDSPSAQLLWEILAAKNIIILSSHETPYVGNWFEVLDSSFIQLFWVYFQAPVTDAQRTEISKLRGLRPPASGFSVPRHHRPQTEIPIKAWATQPESNATQLMLWPHFWRNSEKSEWRHGLTEVLFGSTILGKRSRIDDFDAKLQEVGSVKWTEDFCSFRRIRA